MRQKGLTLLELIVVIIVVSVLAALGITKMYSVVEGSRASEATNAMGIIRRALDRCYLMNDRSYFNGCDDFANIDIENPAGAPNSHFTYVINTNAGATNSYGVAAQRTTRDGGADYEDHAIMAGLGCDVNVASESTLEWNWLEDNKVYWSAATIYKGMIPKGQ